MIIKLHFLDCVTFNSFEQLVKLPTRGPNILDLVLCRNIDELPDVHIIPPLIPSDHEFLSFTITVSNCYNLVPSATKVKPCFRKADYVSINNYLSQINWYYEFSLVKTVEERYSVFLHFINKAIQQYVPLKL